jgi:outer membrane protein
VALAEQEQAFQEKQRQFQEDLAVRKSEELQKVLDAAQKVVEKIAKDEKIDFVLVDAVAYFNPSMDITEKVINSLNGK